MGFWEAVKAWWFVDVAAAQELDESAWEYLQRSFPEEHEWEHHD